MRIYIITTINRLKNNEYQIICYVRTKRYLIRNFGKTNDYVIVLFRKDISNINTIDKIKNYLLLQPNLAEINWPWIIINLDNLINVVNYFVNLDIMDNTSNQLLEKLDCLTVQSKVTLRKRKYIDDKDLVVGFNHLDISNKKRYIANDDAYLADIDDIQ